MTEGDAADRPLIGVRARARAETTRAIVETARRQLAEVGPAALSLRAVARELGLVSSAVYRYVASRDELLTLLIVDAYNALGAAAEDAEGRVPRADLSGRFLAVARAVRGWALANPHEWALIYGSPVPGYAAPQDTIGPATRVPALLLALLADVAAHDPTPMQALPAAAHQALPAAAHEALAPLRAHVADTVPDDLLLRGLSSWALLVGTVSVELFGQLHNVVAEPAAQRDAWFAEAMRQAVVALITG